MLICKNEEQIAKVFDHIEAQGFEWKTPLPLFADEFWDDNEEVPQVDEHCPNCRMLTDRHFNCTDNINGVTWHLHHCLGCETVWFDKWE